MHRMHRAAGVLALVVALAACAAPGTGAGPTDETKASGPAGSSAASEASAAASGSAPAAADTGADDRVDMGALAADPGAVTGEQVTVLARVDRVVVDGVAFLTSPSGTEEDQLAVIVRPEAQLDKDIAEGRVVLVDGTVVGFTAEELQSAGVDIGVDELGDFDGEFAIVADAIRDPLAGDDAS